MIPRKGIPLSNPIRISLAEPQELEPLVVPQSHGTTTLQALAFVGSAVLEVSERDEIMYGHPTGGARSGHATRPDIVGLALEDVFVLDPRAKQALETARDSGQSVSILVTAHVGENALVLDWIPSERKRAGFAALSATSRETGLDLATHQELMSTYAGAAHDLQNWLSSIKYALREIHVDLPETSDAGELMDQGHQGPRSSGGAKRIGSRCLAPR